jgi:hypothetical protein
MRKYGNEEKCGTRRRRVLACAHLVRGASAELDDGCHSLHRRRHRLRAAGRFENVEERDRSTFFGGVLDRLPVQAKHRGDQLQIILNSCTTGELYTGPALDNDKDCYRLLYSVALAAGDASVLGNCIKRTMTVLPPTGCKSQAEKKQATCFML